MAYLERVEEPFAVYERWAHQRHGPALQALNRDPEVTEFLGGELPVERVDDTSQRIEAHWSEHGFGLWAVMLDGECVGFTGAARPGKGWPRRVRKEIELGWRLARAAWGHGLATEGARLALTALSRPPVISLIEPANRRSLAVATRLGMRPGGKAVHRPTGTRVTVHRLP